MAEKSKPKMRKQDDPDQSRRFVEMARELKSDETGKEFRKALKRIAPKGPRAQP